MSKLKHISDSDYQSFRSYCKRNNDLISFCLEILMRTGCRQQELVTLLYDDFDLHEGSIYIRAAKSSHNRTVPVSMDFVDRFKVVFTLLKKNSIGQLLCTGSHESQKRILRRAVAKVQGALFRKVKYSVHSFRHTFALRCLQHMGNDVLKVQMAMGHKSVQSTVRYLQYLQMKELEADILKAVS